MLSYLPDAFHDDGADDIARLVAEFAAAGAQKFVLSHSWCRKSLTDPAFAHDCPRAVRKAGLAFQDAHAPYGAEWDLNGSHAEIESHRRLIGLCAENGVRTYTIHIGPPYGGQSAQEAVARSCRAIERILPAAEEAGVVIACENIYYPTTTSDCLLAVLRAFESPYLRFCYDSGHANLMTNGVRDGTLCDWVEAPWLKAEVSPQVDDFTALWAYLARCHLHDNGAVGDDHNLPGAPGCTIDWPALGKRLLEAPGLISMQTEVHAAVYRLSANDVAGAFRHLAFRFEGPTTSLRHWPPSRTAYRAAMR